MKNLFLILSTIFFVSIKCSDDKPSDVNNLENNFNKKGLLEFFKNHNILPTELNKLIVDYYPRYEIIKCVNLNKFVKKIGSDLDVKAIGFLNNKEIEIYENEENPVVEYNLVTEKFCFNKYTSASYSRLFLINGRSEFTNQLDERSFKKLKITREDNYKKYFAGDYFVIYSTGKKNIKVINISNYEFYPDPSRSIVFEINFEESFLKTLYGNEYFAVSPNLQYFIMVKKHYSLLGVPEKLLIIWRLCL